MYVGVVALVVTGMADGMATLIAIQNPNVSKTGLAGMEDWVVASIAT